MSLTSNTVILHDKENKGVPCLFGCVSVYIASVKLSEIYKPNDTELRKAIHYFDKIQIIPEFENINIIQIKQYDSKFVLLDSNGKIYYISKIIKNGADIQIIKSQIDCDLRITSISMGSLLSNKIAVCGVDNNNFVYLWECDEEEYIFNNYYKLDISNILVANLSGSYICMIDKNFNAWLYVQSYDKIVNIVSTQNVQTIYFYEHDFVILCKNGDLFINSLIKNSNTLIMKNVIKLNHGHFLTFLDEESNYYTLICKKIYKFDCKNMLVDFYAGKNHKTMISDDFILYISSKKGLREIKIPDNFKIKNIHL